MSMQWAALHDLNMEGASPDEPLPTALDILLEDGDHEIVIDLLRGMLAQLGMTGAQMDANLEAACGQWLADEARGGFER